MELGSQVETSFELKLIIGSNATTTTVPDLAFPDHIIIALRQLSYLILDKILLLVDYIHSQTVMLQIQTTMLEQVMEIV